LSLKTIAKMLLQKEKKIVQLEKEIAELRILLQIKANTAVNR
jgi:hypothetical protein